MTAPWMEHPKLVAWFDDLEDAVTTAFALTEEQRSNVKVRRAPRPQTWVMLANDAPSRDAMRHRLQHIKALATVILANDCHVLVNRGELNIEEDTFERENGFNSIEVDYIEEGSIEDLRRELFSDAQDYAASEETGWFYAVLDGEYGGEQDTRDDEHN